MLVAGGGTVGRAQDGDGIAGTYSDAFRAIAALTVLTLNADSTFELSTMDPVFSYTHEWFTNQGQWSVKNGNVVLGSDRPVLEPEVRLIPGNSGEKDSITIQVEYMLRRVRNEEAVEEGPAEFDWAAICINKKGNVHHLVREKKHRICAFAPKVRHQVIVDGTNTFRIPRTHVERIGFFTYGFADIVWLDVDPASSGPFVVHVEHPVDDRRSPRQQKIIVEGNKAYFYQRNGKVNRSLAPLKKR